MTAFLKIDRCNVCQQETPWDWIPPIHLAGTVLAGTGVWRSTLIDGACTTCSETARAARERERTTQIRRERLIQLFGGVKPCREFTFDRYQVAPGNELAFRKAKHFNPANQNLYFWGPCGVGKTHLAYSLARTSFLQGGPVIVLKASQLTRKLRMRTPEEEQQGIDTFVQASVLVLDDLGLGSDTAYTRQVLQEILDGRDFMERGGLVVTGRYPPRAASGRSSDDPIASRLTGMCQIVEIRGADRRLVPAANAPAPIK